MAGYFILHTKWHTLDELDQYQAGAKIALEKHAAEPLVYDVHPEVVEGESNLQATVVFRFESVEAAKAWYHSPEYQAVLPIRLRSSEGIARFVGS